MFFLYRNLNVLYHRMFNSNIVEVKRSCANNDNENVNHFAVRKIGAEFKSVMLAKRTNEPRYKYVNDLLYHHNKPL